MRLNTVMIPLTFGLLAYTVYTVAEHLQQRNAASEKGPSTQATSPLNPGSDSADSERSLLSVSRPLLIAGMSSRVPLAEDYRLISSIPWDAKELARLYRDTGMENSCELIESGADVVVPITPLPAGSSGALGRRSAFSIHLQVGKTLGDGLPGVTRGIIEDYFKAHQLTIQATLYQTERGKLVIGPVLKAAFVQLESPVRTVPPEAMIAKSIGELRTLGAYSVDAANFTPDAARTLVLGFRYTRDADVVTGQQNVQREYELLFLHQLPDSTPDTPRIAVFATSDARTQFHLLEECDPQEAAQLAAITADVRFADVKLLGMYPEAPVVTRVRHRSLLSIQVDMVKAQIAGLAGKPPAGGFSAILDEYYRTATGKETPAKTGDAPASHSDPAAAGKRDAVSPPADGQRKTAPEASKRPGRPAFDA